PRLPSADPSASGGLNERSPEGGQGVELAIGGRPESRYERHAAAAHGRSRVACGTRAVVEDGPKPLVDLLALFEPLLSGKEACLLLGREARQGVSEESGWRACSGRQSEESDKDGNHREGQP